MEKTNQATPATTHQLIEALFDAYGLETIQQGIQAMGIEYLSSDAHCCQDQQGRYSSANLVFDLYHLVEALHRSHTEG
ncbi:MAG: hypothetical protein ACKV1O_30940 [Saprospiraceae bacterium]